MNIPPYDDTDLTADIVLKHAKHLNAVIIEDITTAINLAFGDGYCRGYNAVGDWYTDMDNDISYIESFDGGQVVDTFNDDLMGSPYGDIPNIQDLKTYGDLFTRRNNNE
jgi:hypothetical protein